MEVNSKDISRPVSKRRRPLGRLPVFADTKKESVKMSYTAKRLIGLLMTVCFLVSGCGIGQGEQPEALEQKEDIETVGVLQSEESIDGYSTKKHDKEEKNRKKSWISEFDWENCNEKNNGFSLYTRVDFPFDFYEFTDELGDVIANDNITKSEERNNGKAVDIKKEDFGSDKLFLSEDDTVIYGSIQDDKFAIDTIREGESSPSLNKAYADGNWKITDMGEEGPTRFFGMREDEITPVSIKNDKEKSLLEDIIRKFGRPKYIVYKTGSFVPDSMDIPGSKYELVWERGDYFISVSVVDATQPDTFESVKVESVSAGGMKYFEAYRGLDGMRYMEINSLIKKADGSTGTENSETANTGTTSETAAEEEKDVESKNQQE